MTQAEIFTEAEKLRKSATNRDNWRNAISNFMTEQGIDRRFILTTFEGISVHKPSNDGASGSLGHLGICIWRIS